MSTYNEQPLATQILNTNEQIRAYVNPTRMTILSLLAKEKQSVSRIAHQLNVHPANLTHHFKLLEKTGLIKLVEKRETGKNLEKFYRAVAYQFIVDPDLESTNKQVIALAILRDNLNAAIYNLKNQTNDQDVLGILKTFRVDQQDIKKFEQKLLDLADEFGKSSAQKGIVYSLNVSLYPMDTGDVLEQEIAIRIE
jgi:DNA-binding transcriptional ArsR family regulator